MNNIKDTTFLVGDPIIEGNITTYVLVNDTHLSDVFTQLPHGRVNKTETGIGATSLEFETQRNSIIVQPLRVTAKSKAQEHDAFYYERTTSSSVTSTSSKKLRIYLNDASKKYKKIVVVADSLSKVVEEIGDISSYFLLIDEVDSLQIDSTFRTRMETCMEYYFKFGETNRALVSATLLAFTDQKLEKEPLTIYRYEFPKKRSIRFIHTDTIDSVTYDLLEAQLKQIGLNEKIVVAYNTVKGCLSLAKTLVNNSLCDEKDIKILCGRNEKNQAKIKTYYAELTGDKFPAKVNFTTAAYFNGFDIKEDYHLIIVSNVRQSNTMRSEHNILQIAGRCRRKLLSFNVIHNSFGADVINQLDTYSKDQLIKAAETQIKALECIESHYAGNDVLKSEVEKIRELVLESSSKRNYRFIRKDGAGKLVYSYLNIDAFLENQRVKIEVYSTPKSLHDIFYKRGYNTDFIVTRSQTELQQIEDKGVDYKQLAEEAISEIKKLQNPNLIQLLIEDEYGYGRKADIYKLYQLYKDTVEEPRLLELLEQKGGAKTMKDLNRLSEALENFVSVEDSIVKRNVKAYFKVGLIMDTETLHENIKNVFRDIGTYGPIDTKTAVTLLKTWVDFKDTTTLKGGKKVAANEVLGFNPYGFQRKDGKLEVKEDI